MSENALKSVKIRPSLEIVEKMALTTVSAYEYLNCSRAQLGKRKNVKMDFDFRKLN